MKLRIAIVAFAAIFFQACKPVASVEAETVETLERVIGTVNIEENCGPIIRVIQGDVMRSYSPTNLDSKYAKEGMKLRFNATVSSKKMDGDCSFYSLIEMSEVSAVR